jgi:hypothetical protein
MRFAVEESVCSGAPVMACSAGDGVVCSALFIDEAALHRRRPSAENRRRECSSIAVVDL